MGNPYCSRRERSSLVAPLKVPYTNRVSEIEALFARRILRRIELCYTFGMEKQPINSEEYLKKVEKTELEIPNEELEASVARVSEPFKNLEITEGGVEISEGELKLDIKYGPHTYTRDGEERIANAGKEIISFFVSTESGQVNLLDILPEGVKIVIYPDADMEHGNVMHTNENGIRDVVIQGQINSPKMVAILLHEIGHILDFKKLAELGVEKWVDDNENSDIAEEIRRERAATAFTLKALRPFLKDQTTRQDMINFLKYDALSTYYYSAKEQLRKKREGVVENNIGHGFDDYNDDDRFF